MTQKLEEARKLYQTANADQKYVLEKLFPELKESEDERIKKEIISYLKRRVEMSSSIPAAIGYWIAWLEKQGEKIDIANKEYWRGYREGKQEILDKYAELEKQGEQKPFDYENANIQQKDFAPKVEPKFKVGDWITDGNITIQIEAIKNNCYLYCGDCVLYSTKTADKVYHLWTIQDAKDGDVLASKDKLNILIFRNLDTSISFSSYYNIAGKGELGWSNECFIPATKEQRDLLFQKMKEAGYEWDAEKKELKKIEQKPAWSDEDEKRLQSCLNVLQPRGIMGVTETVNTKWLKSLKGRCTWKPSDEQMKALWEAYKGGEKQAALASLYSDLKKLRKE